MFIVVVLFSFVAFNYTVSEEKIIKIIYQNGITHKNFLYKKKKSQKRTLNKDTKEEK